MKENIVNIIRLTQRTVGFKDNRYIKYYLHINCPCKLKGSSLVGEYRSEAEARYDIPVIGNKIAPSGHCPKNQPLVVEEKPKKARKANRKTRFIRSVVTAVNSSSPTRMGHMTTADGYVITVGRSGPGWPCTSLVVSDTKGNIFELRRQFAASNAENIAKALWELMKEMAA